VAGRTARHAPPTAAVATDLPTEPAYVDQAERGHAALKAAVRAGIVEVQPEH